MDKKIPMWQILIIFIVLIGSLAWTIIVLEGYVHMALLGSALIASIFAVANGFKWTYLEQGIISNIGRSMQAILILFTVGILIGTWIAGGIVPTMIYYGLMILSPGVYLIAACVICSIVSLATGSSWTTAGTVGIALIGIAGGLGIPLPMAAGAVISGAYFGDKMSPLSDTTNLAPAMAGSNLFEHVRHMVFTTGPSLIFALIIFGILGMGHGGSADTSQVDTLMTLMRENFYISPILLIPPLCVIAMVVFKVPPLPGLFGGVILGIICAVSFQGGNFGEVLTITTYDGFVAETGNEFADSLLTRGGFSSMYYSIGLCMCALALGGVLDAANILRSVCEVLLKAAKSTGSLVLTTIVTCLFVNLTAGDQYLAIVLPGRMYKEEFENRRLKNKNLSRCLEDAGTLTSPLVPWNSCGVYMSGALGVATAAYMPYCFLNLINPFVSIFYGYTGITMEKMTDEEYDQVMQQRALDAEIAARSIA